MEMIMEDKDKENIYRGRSFILSLVLLYAGVAMGIIGLAGGSAFLELGKFLRLPQFTELGMGLFFCGPICGALCILHGALKRKLF
jgi:hypothetical protein